VILREHRDDQSLSQRGESFTWPLDGTEEYFSKFRVYMTDRNSNSHLYLALSGFEIYGTLKLQQQGRTEVVQEEEPVRGGRGSVCVFIQCVSECFPKCVRVSACAYVCGCLCICVCILSCVFL